MSERDRLRARIQRLSATLDDKLRYEITIIGGVAPALYPGPNRVGMRATKDIDLIVPAATRAEWYRQTRRFESAGFSYDTESNILCRYRKDDLIVDILPEQPAPDEYSKRL